MPDYTLYKNVCVAYFQFHVVSQIREMFWNDPCKINVIRFPIHIPTWTASMFDHVQHTSNSKQQTQSVSESSSMSSVSTIAGCHWIIWHVPESSADLLALLCIGIQDSTKKNIHTEVEGMPVHTNYQPGGYCSPAPMLVIEVHLPTGPVAQPTAGP